MNLKQDEMTQDTASNKSASREIAANIDLFRHRFGSRVRNSDCDRQNIVHNAVYLYWLEAARVEYFREIGLPIDRKTFITKHHFVVAHLEINYLWAAQFDDEYVVRTRTGFVRNTSFGMDQIISLPDGKTLLTAQAVLVNLNPADQRPQRIPDSYRKLVKDFEGSTVEISQWDKYSA